MVSSTVQGRRASLEIDARRAAGLTTDVLAMDDKHTAPFQAFRNSFGAIVDDENFQAVIVYLIIINAVMMGIGTYNFIEDDPLLSKIFATTDKCFLIIFTIELCFQIIYRGYMLFADGWLCFDFTIVVLSWGFESLQVIRAFRVFRALRLVSRLKQLRDLVMALIDSSPRLSAIGLLLILMFYIFAVMFTMLYGDLYEDGLTTNDNFSRLDKSLFTLFQMLTLDAWSDIMRETEVVSPDFYWIPFLTAISVLSFFVINMMIAVICDAVSSLHSQRAEEKQLGKAAEAELADILFVTEEVHDDLYKRAGKLSRDISYMRQNQEKMQNTLDFLNKLVSRYE